MARITSTQIKIYKESEICRLYDEGYTISEIVEFVNDTYRNIENCLRLNGLLKKPKKLTKEERYILFQREF